MFVRKNYPDQLHCLLTKYGNVVDAEHISKILKVSLTLINGFSCPTLNIINVFAVASRSYINGISQRMGWIGQTHHSLSSH